jgi:hypothetical protein
MRASNVFQIELASTLAKKRSLAMKLGFTLILGFPFVFVDMPAEIQVMGLMMLLLFTSFFGAAVAVARRNNGGLIARLRQLPLSLPTIMGDLLLSEALVDLVQMGIVIALFLWIRGSVTSASAYLVSFGSLTLAVLVLNFLGLLLGLGMRSNAEVHLVSALSLGAIALVSAIFPLPPRLLWLSTGSSWNPVALLAAKLRLLIAPQTGAFEAPEVLAWALFIAIIGGVLLWRGVFRR